RRDGGAGAPRARGRKLARTPFVGGGGPVDSRAWAQRAVGNRELAAGISCRRARAAAGQSRLSGRPHHAARPGRADVGTAGPLGASRGPARLSPAAVAAALSIN